MCGAIGSMSGCQCIPIQSSPSRWTNALHVYCPRLSRTNLLEGLQHLRMQRLSQRTKKRQPLCRKPREVLVIVLQDYQTFEGARKVAPLTPPLGATPHCRKV